MLPRYIEIGLILLCCVYKSGCVCYRTNTSFSGFAYIHCIKNTLHVRSVFFLLPLLPRLHLLWSSLGIYGECKSVCMCRALIHTDVFKIEITQGEDLIGFCFVAYLSTSFFHSPAFAFVCRSFSVSQWCHFLSLFFRIVACRRFVLLCQLE